MSATSGVIYTTNGMADAAYYEDGQKVYAGHTDEVMEQVLARLGVDIEPVSTITPPGTYRWADVPESEADLVRLNA